MLDVQSDSSLDRLLDNRPKQSSPTAALVMGKSTVGPNNTLIDLMKEGGAEAGIISEGIAQAVDVWAVPPKEQSRGAHSAHCTSHLFISGMPCLSPPLTPI